MTEENIICTMCNGSKKILGMGSMPMYCPECNGTGVMTKPEAVKVPASKPKKNIKSRSNKDSGHAD